MNYFALPLLALSQLTGCTEREERPDGFCSLDISGQASVKIDNSAKVEEYTLEADVISGEISTQDIENQYGYTDDFIFVDGEARLDLTIPYRDPYIGWDSTDGGEYQPVIASLALESAESFATVQAGDLIGECDLNGAEYCFELLCTEDVSGDAYDLP